MFCRSCNLQLRFIVSSVSNWDHECSCFQITILCVPCGTGVMFCVALFHGSFSAKLLTKRMALSPHSTTPTSTPTPTRPTRRHPGDDPREDVDDDVGIGVVECGLYRRNFLKLYGPKQRNIPHMAQFFRAFKSFDLREKRVFNIFLKIRRITTSNVSNFFFLFVFRKYETTMPYTARRRSQEFQFGGINCGV